MLTLIVIINGVLALIFKHKGNFFIIRKYNNPFTNDNDYTFTPEYDKRFILSFAIYFAPIPFYLPLILFTSDIIHMERTVAVQEKAPILPQTETILNYPDKQQIRTFHR